MDEDHSDVETRRRRLIEELEAEARRHDRTAHTNEFLVSAFFYISLFFGGLAVVCGLIKSISIPTELISLFAAIGTGATFLAKEAKYRARADWHYSVRDTAKQLIARLNYEMPIPVTRDDVAAISEEWRRRRAELGDKMAAIHGSPPRQRAPSRGKNVNLCTRSRFYDFSRSLTAS
jgi:hypothetical protein